MVRKNEKGKLIMPIMWSLTCFIMGFGLATCIYCKDKKNLKVGDIVRLKHTDRKYILFYQSADRTQWYLTDMKYELIDSATYHENLLEKVKNDN